VLNGSFLLGSNFGALAPHQQLLAATFGELESAGFGNAIW